MSEDDHINRYRDEVKAGCGKVIAVVFFSILLLLVIVVGGEALLSDIDGKSLSDMELPNSSVEDPDLYELSRQTAENTRWIFWVLVVGVIELGCLSAFVMFKKN